ncbi:AAA family ATPase [Thioalkalivibrio sp. ALJT]|uniref:AAA family ATPase n=1 Tax=Thioalkalivibrio sp. ALJT TaxID=1158146 RepID=UPI000362DFFA|nr:AAA family ATPase [Thioalkalivibrio sp. ALJT]
MRTVVANLKGGTGKSTVAFNLGLWLLEGRRRVLAVDLDPQCTLSDALEVRQEEGFEPALDVTSDLESAQAHEGDYDEILIDVGASDMAALMAAVEGADRVLIPVPPSQADVWATYRFVTRILEQRGNRNRPEILAFINRADTHTAVRESDETCSALEQIEGVRLLQPRLKQRMAFRRSFSEGLSVHELEPRGKAAAELDALAVAVFGGRRQ